MDDPDDGGTASETSASKFPPGDPDLRRRAAEQLERDGRGDPPAKPEEVEAVLHELRVHQIELEMQNDELLRTQLDLEAARARYFDLWDLAPVGYLTLDQAGSVIEANLEAARLLHAERVDVAGRRLSEFVHPESQDDLYLFWRAPSSPAETSLDLRLRSPREDEEHWVRLTASSPDPRGEAKAPRRVILADITERRRAERRLQVTEARATELFARSPVALLDIDASRLMDRLEQSFVSGEDGARLLIEHVDYLWPLLSLARVDSANMAALDLFAATTLQELEDALVRCFTDESISALTDIAHRVAAGVTTFSVPVSISTPGGRPRSTDLVVKLLPGDKGRLDRAIASFVDLTDRQHAETDIRHLNAELQKQVAGLGGQLEALAGELETQTYAIAHDLRTPLRAIDGFAEEVLESELPRLSDEGASDLNRMRAATQTLAQLLDDLVCLTQLGSQSMSIQTVDVSALARHVGDEIAADHSSRSVEFVVAEGLSARADRLALRRILRELLDNAWKFSAPRAGARIEVGSSETDAGRAFYVRDDGVGFDPRRADHLFGAFQRMHPPDAFEGRGVGLATVQRLVRRHGGHCWASSEPGQGATFYFTLPDRTTDEPA
jgi:PAS domain S-box-containing protein